MSWIQTYTGKKFCLGLPIADVIDIVDIAHALSNLCRFNGHCKQFYSVAQHSVFVHDLLAGESREIRFAGLMHDAAEAYIGDVPSPIKHQVIGLLSAEEDISLEIAHRFCIDHLLFSSEQIKHADMVALATEKRDLMAPEPEPWVDLPAPADEEIIPLGPIEAREEFIERYFRFKWND